MNSIKKSKLIAYLGLLLALDIVLTRFLQLGSAQFPLLIPGIPWRVDFGYVPASICAALFGPWWGALEALAADLIGFFLMPVGGAFYPGYTILAITRCIIYGLFLYGCTATQYRSVILRCILAVLCVALISDLALKSVSDMLLYGNPFMVVLAKNAIPASIKFIVRCITLPLYMVWVNKYLRNTFVSH